MSELVLDQPLRPLLELVELGLVEPEGTVLDGITCGFDMASITGVIGIAGAGRAGLFELITGHVPPTTGTIRFGGLRIDRLGPIARVRLGILAMRRRRLITGATLGKTLAIARAMVVRPWWRVAFGLGTGPSPDDREDIAGILDFLDIGHLAERPVQGLGGLEARLAEFARCLVQRPRLLLLEHPLAGLAGRQEDPGPLLVRLRRAELTLVIVDDDLATLGRIADRCLALERGRLIADATPEAIGTAPHVFRMLTGAEL
jgi:branched-chain amino acid transport system ATP-binding protein